MNFNESCIWIEAQKNDLLSHLIQLSEINSGTSNFNGIKEVGRYFQTYFAGTADSCEEIPSKPREHIDINGDRVTEEFGNILRFQKRAKASLQVLLVGHLDTVFSSTHGFQFPQKLDERTLLGPGVADMKGGILVMLTALQAFEALDQSGQLGWQVILNADEETGSHGSIETLVNVAEKADVGLIYEPSLADGTLSRARKGSGNFTIVAKGRAAHAGREFALGRNAITALYSYAIRMEQLTDLKKGISVNIARMSGGTAFNVVPEKAVLQLNIRCRTVEQQHSLESNMREILEEISSRNEVSLELSGCFSRPPKTISAANQLLMDWVVDSGNLLNIEVQFKDTGGCCDGNNLAAAGLPNVDTLGVQGGKIHTAEEFMIIPSLTERAKLSLSILEKLAREGEYIKELNDRRMVNSC
tara:strand:- start:2647 stop:3891 length:1245 start_codon:yes stop_codon:yes gene_type:complete